MKILPIAVTDFAEFSRNNYFYVDKTRILHKLLRRPMPYFLSRPRRFGKTLLVSALERVLRGQRELFKGLWIYDSDYNWAPHPVIKLEMNALKTSSPEALKADLLDYLGDIAKANNLDISKAPSPLMAFSELIWLLYAKHNEGITDETLKKEVAVLIDEYDTPIINNLGDPTLAAAIKDTLADFYGILKTNGTKRGFVFMTGICRFTSRFSFSSLNNFEDLTLNPSYLNNCRTNPDICGHDPKVCARNINHDCDINFSDICGFNLRELEELLSDSLDQTFHDLKANESLPPDSSHDDVLKLIQDWYGAYSWDGKTKVFNPFTIISFLKDKRFRSHWYWSGSPTFPPKLVQSRQIIFDLSQELVFSGKSWNSIDEMDKQSAAILLFQTGYLTVKEIITNPQARPSYRLGHPNLEVATALGPFLLSIKAPKNPLLAQKFCQKAFEALFKLDAEGFQAAFSDFLGQIPFDPQPDPEKYYQSLFLYAIFLADQAFYRIAGQTIGGQTIGGPRGKLRPHATLKDPEGHVFITQIKRLVVEGQEENSEISLKMAALSKGLAKKMATLAKETLSQINHKYVPDFLADSNRIFNVAVVVAGLNTVLTKIKEVKRDD